MVARTMAQEGHAVTILDTNEDNLRRLPDHLGVTTLLGDGTLEQDLRRAGIEEADVFVAVEDRDSRNALAAQKARNLFKVRKVICDIGDPVRQEMYRSMGLEAISPAKAASDMILQAFRR